MYQLQLCPFCGGEARVIESYDSPDKLFGVKIECKDCGATQPVFKSTNPPSAELESSEHWNSRSSVVKAFLDPDPYEISLWYESSYHEGTYGDYLKEWKIPEDQWHLYWADYKPRKPKVTK